MSDHAPADDAVSVTVTLRLPGPLLARLQGHATRAVAMGRALMVAAVSAAAQRAATASADVVEGDAVSALQERMQRTRERLRVAAERVTTMATAEAEGDDESDGDAEEAGGGEDERNPRGER